jgi:micrococcal nuclease
MRSTALDVRTRSCVACLLVGLLGIPTLAGQARELVGRTLHARVVSVVDGDTVDVVLNGERRPIRIRLEGIDTPERGEPFSDAAKRFTRTLMFDKAVSVDARDIDRYGRLVARVSVGRTDSSRELVAAGLACHYTQYSSDPVLANAEATARTGGHGFWLPGAQKPHCAGGPRSAERSLAATESSNVARPFHGNTSSHVYHATSCPNYNCRNCTRSFSSENEARAAGFRPAADCLSAKKPR